MPAQEQKAQQAPVEGKNENDGLFPNVPIEFRNMSTWEEFISNKLVRDNLPLFNHAISLSKMGITFKAFKRYMNNKESFEKLMKMSPKKLTGQI